MPFMTDKDWLEQARDIGLFTDSDFTIRNDSVLRQAASQDCLTATDALSIRDLMDSINCFDEDLALLLAAAFFELNRGSVCLRVDKETISVTARRMCGCRKSELVDRITDRLQLLEMGKGPWQGLIGLSAEEFKPLILVQKQDVGHLYFQRHLVNSLGLKHQLERLFSAPPAPLATTDVLKDTLDAVFARQPHALNDRQRLAVATAALQRFTIVSGGPGTGKTSIVVALLQCMLQCGIELDQIRAVAPTGRAAQRMSESVRSLLPDDPCETDKPLLDLKCQTLHALLRYDPSRNAFVHNEEFPLTVKAVILDEVSMIDVEMMAALLSALPEDARVIFLGDKDQLPSVEAGAILAELIPSESDFPFTPTFQSELHALIGDSAAAIAVEEGDAPMKNRIIVLDTSYRSERSILHLAELVNAGNEKALDAMESVALTKRGLPFETIDHGAFHCDCSTASRDRLRAILDSWAVAHYLHAAEFNWLDLLTAVTSMDLSDLSSADSSATETLDGLFAHLGSAQILTLTRHGGYGVSGVNAYLTGRLKPICDPDCQGRYFHGEPIIVQRNDRTWGLYNGDVGIVLRGNDTHYRAVFKRMNQYVSLGLDALPTTEAAFAITVHKSQGSEYGRVMFVLPPKEDSPLLCREILYTGITRAKNAAIVIGSSRVMKAAISRKNHREGGIGIWGDDAKTPQKEVHDFDDLPLFQ